MQNKFIIIMGVSGSGKTTIGEMLAEQTGYEFYDADHFHPQQNIDKMKAGVALTDEDRWPWLESIHLFAKEKLQSTSIIVACSALKESYRFCLSKDIGKSCLFVFLQGDADTISKRMQQRHDHYMPSSLLQSQFDILEIPKNAITINILEQKETIVQQIIASINKN